MRAFAAVLGLGLGCGGGDAPPDGGPGDALAVGPLFGEPCELPPFPQVADCRDGSGSCIAGASGAGECRPYCVADGYTTCAQREGVERITDRGVCVCTPN